VHEFLPDELREALNGRFANVVLYRQTDWSTSAILDDRTFVSGTDGELADAVTRKISDGEADSELYTLALAGDGALPQPRNQAVMNDGIDWRQLVADAATLRHALAERDQKLESKDRELGEARRRLEEEEQRRKDRERDLEQRDSEIARLRELLAAHEEREAALARARLIRVVGRYYSLRSRVKRLGRRA
jgi:hypothetical protein